MTKDQRDEIFLRLAELVAEMARVLEDGEWGTRELREARQELEAVLENRKVEIE